MNTVIPAQRQAASTVPCENTRATPIRQDTGRPELPRAGRSPIIMTLLASEAPTTADTSRPSWLTEPCPSWCIAPHQEMDPIEERVHGSVCLSVPMSLAVPIPSGPHTYRAPDLQVSLIQHVRETAPRVELAIGEDGGETNLVLAETQALFLHLSNLLAWARKG